MSTWDLKKFGEPFESTRGQGFQWMLANRIFLIMKCILNLWMINYTCKNVHSAHIAGKPLDSEISTWFRWCTVDVTASSINLGLVMSTWSCWETTCQQWCLSVIMIWKRTLEHRCNFMAVPGCYILITYLVTAQTTCVGLVDWRAGDCVLLCHSNNFVSHKMTTKLSQHGCEQASWACSGVKRKEVIQSQMITD